MEDRCEILVSFLFCCILLIGALLCFIHYRLCIHLNCQNLSDANVKTSFELQRGHGGTFVCGVNQSVFQTKTNLDSALIRNGAAINFTDRRIHWSPFSWYSENSSFLGSQLTENAIRGCLVNETRGFRCHFGGRKGEIRVGYDVFSYFVCLLNSSAKRECKNKLVETRNKSSFWLGMLKFLFDF